MNNNLGKNDFVESSVIKTYSEIDGLLVIEELLLFKGCEIANQDRSVLIKYLEDTALITYSLKYSRNNRLYVGMHLDRIYRRLGLVLPNGRIKVPKEIYDKVKVINDSYKTKDNQIDEY